MKTGWQELPLKDLCQNFKDDIVDGPFGASLKREHYQGSGVPVLKIQNIKPFQVVEKKMDYVSSEKARELSRHSFVQGDIIVTKLGTPLGISAIVKSDVPGIIVADLVRVRAKKVNTQFLCYQLNSPRVSESLNALQGGATRPRVRLSALRDLRLAVPPLEEQQRIVAVLDEAFEGLTRAREHAEANLQNAAELFATSVDAIFSEIDEDWRIGPVSELVGSVSTGPFGSLLHKSDYVENETPLINPANILDGKIVPDNRKTVSEDALKRLSSYVLRAGDLVIGRRGEMGRCGVVETTQDGWLCGTGSFFIRPNPGVVPQYVAHAFRSATYVAKLEALSTGATMANISNRALGNLEIALPDFDQQLKHLQRIEELQQAVARLENLFVLDIKNLDHLRQSLLQRAFAGELS